MAESIAKYGIAIGFEDALKGLKTFTSAMSKMEKARTVALKKHIKLQQKLNGLMKSGGSSTSSGNRTSARSKKSDWLIVEQAIEKRKAKELKAETDILVAKQISKNRAEKLAQDEYRTVEKFNQKRIKAEQSKQQKLFEARATAEAKAQALSASKQKSTQNAKIKQAVDNLVTGSGTGARQANADYYSKMAKDADKVAKVEAKLDKMRFNFANKNILYKKGISAEQIKVWQTAQRQVKTERELKALMAAQLRTATQLTSAANKRNFAMQRMKASSKQIAGNMVSAFAVTAGVASATKIGQDFESIGNTMLAVSENSDSAGTNMKFVRDEAYRLGLNLKESTKGYAKMLAARGNMSVADAKSSFTGVAEMSTLLGLSSEETSRTLTALQQMMSKGVVSAKLLVF